MSERRIYLDNGATTWPKKKELLQKTVEIYGEIGASPGRGSHDQAAVAENFVGRARSLVANFFHAPDPDRVIFTANATDGLNIALLGLLKAGDHVVTTHLEHNSVLRPLHYLQKARNITTTFVPFNDHGMVDPEDIRRAIGASTALVVVNHASNVLGTVQPITKIGMICRDCGVPLLVDCSQSVGHIPVNMEEMAISAMIFTGHKALYGPTGIGGLIFKPDLDIRPSRFGGTGIDSGNMEQTQALPYRLEAGTLNLLGIIGLSLAVEDCFQENGTKHYEFEMALTRKLYNGLQELPGVILYGGTMSADHVPLFSVNISGVHSEDLSAILDGDFNISVRPGLHCSPLVHETLGTVKQGAVRFSLGHYTTQQDIDEVLAAMRRIAAYHY